MKHAGLLFLLALVLGSGTAVADDEQESRQPPSPLEAVHEIVAAHESGDVGAFERLAKRIEPDAWLVAFELLAVEPKVAEAYVATRQSALVDWQQLVGQPQDRKGHPLTQYVRGRMGSPVEAEMRQFVREAESLEAAGKPEAAREILAPFESTDPVLRARAARVRGRALHALGSQAEACTAFRSAAVDAARVGWLRWALPCWAEVAVEAAAIGDEKLEAKALVEAAKLHMRLGRTRGASLGMQTHEGIDRAAPLIERAVTIQRAAGDREGAARTLVEAYDARSSSWSLFGEELWDLASAAVWLERANDIYAELGITIRQIEVVRKMATAYERASAFARSIEWHHVALDLKQQLANKTKVPFVVFAFGSFRDLADMHRRMGDRPGELRVLRRWLDACDQIEGKLRALRAYPASTLTALYADVGDLESAIQNERATLEHHLTAQDGLEAMSQVTLGRLLLAGRRPEQAIAMVEPALESDTRGYAAAVVRGRAQEALGRCEEADATYERWLETRAKNPRSSGAVRMRIARALALSHLGEFTRAIEILESPHNRRLPPDLRSSVHAAMAEVRRAADDPRGAIQSARAYFASQRTIGGASTFQGARDSRSTPRPSSMAAAAGAVSAARLADAGESWFFLERDRAQGVGSILGRRVVRSDRETPAQLARAEQRVRREQAVQRARMRTARERGDLKEAREARRTLAALTVTLRRIAGEIQSIAIAGASGSVVAPMERVQEVLEKGDALVSYGVYPYDAIALVLTRDGARVVQLGSKTDLQATCSDFEEGLIDPEKDPSSAGATLRRALVEPLRLDDMIHRVYVSADGWLHRVPFSLLLENRTVLSTPSGTVLALLAMAPDVRGTDVLALGDPDYSTTVDAEAIEIYRSRSGGQLVRLPDTGVEAKAVGSMVLLGREASESSFREVLDRDRRWRAVHLACHGLIDADRPLLSSLALTGTNLDDGFVSVLDVMRMRVRADLVVLSACETARGTLLRGEGVMGLPRAFLLAGSRRVISSLWKVDDEATRALMVKFYDLWNPGERKASRRVDPPRELGAAAALKAAQEYVRSHEKWKHPYYWAAWVLWGPSE